MELAWFAVDERPRILIVGDVILDRFVHGDAQRISPEAPVPVVRQTSVEHRPGGAANVAANVVALGGSAELFGVVGADPEAARLAKELEALGVPRDGLVTLDDRPTTVKTRIVARHQQVLRVDVEEAGGVSQDAEHRLGAGIAERLPASDALVISDYAKGVASERLLREVLGGARDSGTVVVVDPKSPRLERYSPATVVTPNQAELAWAAGRDLHGLDEVEAAAREQIRASKIDAFVVTLGERGMLVVPREGRAEPIAARGREVFDVTGAGDTVTAALALALAAGAPLVEAARVANAAAAVAVSRLGTTAVTWEEVQQLTGGE